MKTMRHRNNGLRKLCDCSRRHWPKCSHDWHFNFKPRGGPSYRFSLDVEVGRPLKSKTEAEGEAERIRTEIRAGTFVRASARASASEPKPIGVTLDAFALLYIERQAQTSGKKTWKNDEHMLAQLRAFRRPDGTRLGEALLASITEDELEAFHAELRTKGRAASTRNQYVQLLKASFRWAAKKGYIARSPITEDSTLGRTKIAQRTRRLVADVLDEKGTTKQAGEERRLLDATTKNPGMQRLIIAALETGCRRGELLGLQWADVDVKRREIKIRGENAKDAETRLLPISGRLAGVLEMAKVDPAGNEYPPDAYVFGECGRRIKSIKRAWLNACARAHVVDLHFHDLRHEAGSRMLEAGWPIHHVKEMLGHANVAQTSTYLNVGRMGLHESMERFNSSRCNPVAISRTEEQPITRNEDAPEPPKSLIN